MTSHELARKLLELPEARTVATDGCCDHVRIEGVSYFTEMPEDKRRVHLLGYILDDFPIIYLDTE